jgi:hypothetical protein
LVATICEVAPDESRRLHVIEDANLAVSADIERPTMVVPA